MINLIPEDIKTQNSYAIKNRVLIRWVLAFFIGIIGIGLAVWFGHFQLNRTIASTQEEISQSEERLSQQDLEGTQKQTKEIDNSIKLAIKVLEKRIIFSKLLQQIGSVMPPGTRLQDLSLQEELNGGVNLIARAESYQAATQVQVNLSDPSNEVFKQADIISINCSEPSEEDSVEDSYPCTVTLRALFNEDNPFQYINQEQNDE